ncbi:MAG: hypothetical protein IJH68_02580 [Thermoguttaceae bacterium]|nr:hypothetical protein [Thermoguttaceae bacterium]
MKDKPKKQLTAEEYSAQMAAESAFDLKPYLDRLAGVLSASWENNDIGGIAVDLTEAWMATPCPHGEDYFDEFCRVIGLIHRLTDELEKTIGTQKLIEIERRIDESYRFNPDNKDKNDSPLRSMMVDFADGWLLSYSPCYPDSKNVLLLEFWEGLPRGGEYERWLKLWKNSPYDPSRIDEKEIAELLILDSTANILFSDPEDSARVDSEDIARRAGVRLGRAVFEAYPECRGKDEYHVVVSCICDGVRNILMGDFGDSKLTRLSRFTPRDLYEDLRWYAEIEIQSLRENRGEDGPP